MREPGQRPHRSKKTKLEAKKPAGAGGKEPSQAEILSMNLVPAGAIPRFQVGRVTAQPLGMGVLQHHLSR